MSDPITPERLAAIRARCEAAAGGPWQLDGPFYWPYDFRADPTPSSSISAGEERIAVLIPVPANLRAEQDMAFTAHARTDVPDLLAEVERLRVELNIVRQDAEKWTRVEYTIERAVEKGGDLDARELLDLAEGEQS